MLIRTSILLFVVLAAHTFAQSIPAVRGKTLDGLDVSLPNPARDKPVLLMLGFSHKSSDDFDHWNKAFKAPYLTDARLDYFEVVELQGVPSFVNGMILHGMRRSVPKPQHSHFLTIYSGEEQWKRIVNFAPADVAYLVLADKEGKVVWQTHGPETSEKSEQLEAVIAKLSSRSPNNPK